MVMAMTRKDFSVSVSKFSSQSPKRNVSDRFDDDVKKVESCTKKRVHKIDTFLSFNSEVE